MHCRLQLASSLRARGEDRCSLLVSLLSDAEGLTSYVNSLMCIDDRRPHTTTTTTPAICINDNVTDTGKYNATTHYRLVKLLYRFVIMSCSTGLWGGERGPCLGSRA